jgi:hypothetical protein
MVTAVLMVIIPAWQSLTDSPFGWAVQQPQTWQGGIEAIVLGALVCAGLAINRRTSLLLLFALPAVLYLRRHAADLPLLIDLVYFEIVIGLGFVVRRALGDTARAQTSIDYLHAFVLGLIAWSLCAWTLSALHVGSITTLRWLTLALAIPGLLVRQLPFCVFVARRVHALARPARLWAGVGLAWMCVLCARSRVVTGYDPLWYGLRPEYVFAPGNSVFESLGLVSPVYYFPKLYEMFLLPVSALGDAGVIDGMTLLILVLIVLACRVLMQRIDMPATAQSPLLLLIATTPALANTAIGPKPDIIATLFVLLAAHAACELSHARITAGAWLMACGLLAVMAKLVAIPYVAVVVLAGGIMIWRARKTPVIEPALPRRIACITLAGAGVVSIFVTARTFVLTGMPTIGPDALFALWQALGLHLREPVGTLPWSAAHNWSSQPGVLFDIAFRPYHDMATSVITWIGNAWLWLGALAFIALLVQHRRMTQPSVLPLSMLALCGLFMLFGVGWTNRGGDGNYFIYALLPGLIVLSRIVFSRLSIPAISVIMIACLSFFIAFQAAYSFNSAGWTCGTRAFDLQFNHGWRNLRSLRKRSLDAAGLSIISSYLAADPKLPRVVGYVQEPEDFLLPARFEHPIMLSYSRPEYLADSEPFLHFLRVAKIGYLILPLPETEQKLEPSPAVLEAARQWEKLPGVRRIDDTRYMMLDLRSLTLSKSTEVTERPQ